MRMEDDDQKALKADSNGKADHVNGKVTTAENTEKQPKFLCYKILKQLTLINAWIALGLFLEILGPTLTDLKNNINVDYEEISRVFLAKSGGFLIGSIVGGTLHERFYAKTDLIMAVGIFIGAVGITFVPLMPNLPLLGCMMMLTGMSEGFMNTGGNTMVLHLWGKKAAAPMCSLHFGFGIGAMLVPQLAAQYLAPVHEENVLNTTVMHSDVQGAVTELPYTIDTSTVSDNTTDTYKLPQLAVPYAIVGAYTTLSALLMLVFFIYGLPKGFERRKGTKEFRKLFNPAQCGYGSGCYGMILLCLLFVYYIQATGGERAFGKYISSYSLLNDVKFTKQQSANLASVFWFSHMAGRLTGTLVSYWVPITVTMVFFISTSIVSSVVLAIYGYNVSLVLWIFSGVMGFCISLGFPSGMSWANLNMRINSVAVMVLLMGASTGGFIYQYLPGYLFTYVGPRTLMYVMVAYGVLLAITVTIMELVSRKIGNHVKDNFIKERQAQDEKELEIIVKTKL